MRAWHLSGKRIATNLRSACVTEWDPSQPSYSPEEWETNQVVHHRQIGTGNGETAQLLKAYACSCRWPEFDSSTLVRQLTTGCNSSPRDPTPSTAEALVPIGARPCPTGMCARALLKTIQMLLFYNEKMNRKRHQLALNSLEEGVEVRDSEQKPGR